MSFSRNGVFQNGFSDIASSTRPIMINLILQDKIFFLFFRQFFPCFFYDLIGGNAQLQPITETCTLIF